MQNTPETLVVADEALFAGKKLSDFNQDNIKDLALIRNLIENKDYLEALENELKDAKEAFDQATAQDKNKKRLILIETNQRFEKVKQFIKDRKNKGRNDLLTEIDTAPSEAYLNLLILSIIDMKSVLLEGQSITTEQYKKLKIFTQQLSDLKIEQDWGGTRLFQGIKKSTGRIGKLLPGTYEMTKQERDAIELQIAEIQKSMRQKEESYLNSGDVKDGDLVYEKIDLLNTLLDHAERSRSRFNEKRQWNSVQYTIAFVFSIISTAASAVGNIPGLNLITNPIKYASNLLYFGFLHRAIRTDPTRKEETRQSIRDYLDAIRNYKRAEALTNLAGTALIFGSLGINPVTLSTVGAVLFPPLILPATLCMFAANLLSIKTAQTELELERKHGGEGPIHEARMIGLAARVSARKATALGAGFALVAALAVVTIAFPPAGLGAVALGIVAKVAYAALIASILPAIYGAGKSIQETKSLAKAETLQRQEIDTNLSKQVSAFKNELTMDIAQKKEALLKPAVESPTVVSPTVESPKSSSSKRLKHKDVFSFGPTPHAVHSESEPHKSKEIEPKPKKNSSIQPKHDKT